MRDRNDLSFVILPVRNLQRGSNNRGIATFGLRYFAQLRSKYKGVFWRVEIAERDYSGPSKEMEFAGGFVRFTAQVDFY